MTYPLRWIMSLLFNIQMYLSMLVVALAYAPYAILSRNGAFGAVHAYCRWVRFSARYMIGLRSEVRGTPPQGDVLIASKHQSFFDIIMIASEVPRPKFIMKKELLYTPIVGQYATRIGCVAVDRGKRGRAIAEMKRAVAAGAHMGGQMIIFPQGTRVAPDVSAPYKVGAGLLYQQLDQPCIPAATNVGVFWPRSAVMRKPGLAIVEFLPPIAPGKPLSEFMGELEQVIEAGSLSLMAEAGYTPPKG